MTERRAPGSRLVTRLEQAPPRFFQPCPPSDAPPAGLLPAPAAVQAHLSALRAAIGEDPPPARLAPAPAGAAEAARLPPEAPLPAGLPACIDEAERAQRLLQLGAPGAAEALDRALRGLRLLLPPPAPTAPRRPDAMMRRSPRRR